VTKPLPPTVQCTLDYQVSLSDVKRIEQAQ